MKPIRHVLYKFICAILLLVPLAGITAAEPDFLKRASVWEKQLRELEKQADARTGTPGELRASLQELSAALQNERRELLQEVAEVQTNLDSLGPRPDEDAPPESSTNQRQRQQYETALGEFNSKLKQCELMLTRSDLLSRQLLEEQFEQRTGDLLKREPLPYQLETLRAAASELTGIIGQIHRSEVVEDGVRNIIAIPLLVLGTLIAVTLGRMLRQRIQTRYGRDPSLAAPSYGRRWIAAVVEAMSHGLVPAVAVVILLTGLWWLLASQVVTTEKHWGILAAILFYLLSAALVRAAFAPDLPNWRVAPVSAYASKIIGRRLHWLALVFAINMAVNLLFTDIAEPAAFFTLHSTVLNVFLALVLLSLLGAHLWQAQSDSQELLEGESRPVMPALSGYVRLALGLVAVTTLVANLLGYPHLANYLLHNTLFTLLMVGGMVSLRALLREIFSHLVTDSSGPAKTLKDWLAITEPGSRLINVWGLALIDFLLVGGGILLGLLIWGIPPNELYAWLVALFKGFNVGSYHFSLTDVLLAIAAFVGILVVTRIIQRFLEFRLLPNTSLDIGIRTAITAGLGYLGFALALLAGISTLGVKLTGVAWVATALSVGIGFGLQNIVNNFISGIILLIERPVKVGDTVAIKEHEGVIRRINVRSTELETSAQAAVIIPNAELLQNAVVNWTHHARSGRAELKLAVAYHTDIDQAEKLLLECARGHRQVARYPAPVVHVTQFAERGVELALSFKIADIDDKATITSEIRKAILRVFRENKIIIPAKEFPA